MPNYSVAKPAGRPTWADLITPDPEAARSFYKAVFGWEYDVGGPEYGGYSTARSGQHMTAGIVGQQPGSPSMPAAWSLYFASDDIEADVARAVDGGAKVLFPVTAVSEFGTMATCEDPTGATFSFWQAGQHIGAQVTDEPGSMIWYELYASNAQQARDFYTELLHATADQMPGGFEYYVLKHGDEMLGGIMQIDPAWGGFQPQWTIYFAVANADETAAVISEHGGKILGTIDDTPFGRMAAVIDPHGATFKILQPPSQ